MISIFNRKELLVTFSMQKQSQVREMLATNNIDYIIKTVNRNSPSIFSSPRGRTGTFGQNIDFTYEYIIYVNKKDFEEAFAILNGNYDK